MNKVILGVILALTATSCQLKVEPGIQAGIDECENCSMIIQDVDQGAVAIDTDEQLHTFCNPVCLIYETNKLKEAGVVSSWQSYLFNHADNAAIPVRAAFIAQGDFRTAMGFGLLAFTSQEEAAAFSNDVNGEVIEWDDLRLQYETPDAAIILPSGDDSEPETFEVFKGQIISVAYDNRSSSIEKIELTGYDFDFAVGPETEGQSSFIAGKPGQGFAFQKNDGSILGILFVGGDHTAEEAIYR